MYILNLFCAVEVTQIYSLNLEGKTPWQREGILRKASVFTEALYPQSMVLCLNSLEKFQPTQVQCLLGNSPNYRQQPECLDY